MKVRKLLAGILAGTMVLGSAAVTTSAATTKLDKGSLTCEAFWGAHTSGIAVQSELMTLNFQAKSSGSSSYCCPVYVVYSSDDGKAYSTAATDTDGQKHNYKEYLVCRGDLYSWTSAGSSAWSDGTLTEGTLGKGYKFTGTAPAVDEGTDWTAYFLQQLKKGQKGTITAKVSGKKVTVTYKLAGAESTATIPVDSTKNLYIGLTGENCKITSMKYSYASSLKAQTLSLYKSSLTINESAVSEKAKTYHMYVKGNKTTLTVAAADSKSKKALTIKKASKSSRSGYTQYDITVKKGTAADTYKVSVKAKKSSKYSAASKTYKIKVK